MLILIIISENYITMSSTSLELENLNPNEASLFIQLKSPTTSLNLGRLGSQTQDELALNCHWLGRLQLQDSVI